MFRVNSLFYAVLRRFYRQFSSFTAASKDSILRSLPSQTLAQTKNIDNVDDLKQLYYSLQTFRLVMII